MNMIGSLGTISGLLLVIIRCIFLIISFYIMHSDHQSYSFTVIRISIIAMLVIVVWSCLVACYDIAFLFKGTRHHHRTTLIIVVIIEVLAMEAVLIVISLSLGLTTFLARDSRLCRTMTVTCHRYFISIGMAIIALLCSIIRCVSIIWMNISI